MTHEGLSEGQHYAPALAKGNEAIARAALDAGCRAYFGYPITPQSEIIQYMASAMPARGGAFLQAESELAAVNMVYGASATGIRAMTSSSGPGISLMQEGFSFLAGARLPAVIVNIQRAGPGLGGILPSQGDYFQATKGGGHGDYRNLVLSPASVQEAYDLTRLAFDLADRYRVLALILSDGTLGQMMESCQYRAPLELSALPAKDHWAAEGLARRGAEVHNVITSIFIDPDRLEAPNVGLQSTSAEIARVVTRWVYVPPPGPAAHDDAPVDVVLVAFGVMARVCREVALQLAEEGLRCAVLRPITLWPFPSAALAQLAERASAPSFLVVELNAGQMVEDVRLAVGSQRPVASCGRLGGHIPDRAAIASAARALAQREEA